MNSVEKKKLALELIDQMCILENIQDQNYKKILAEKHIYNHGESVLSFHLKALKELVEAL